jgi:biopolymer transport protein ExbB
VWQLAEIYSANRDFVESGGLVLLVILGVVFLMWTLILERFWYLKTAHETAVRELVRRWDARRDKTSWYAEQVRRAGVSRVSMALGRNIPMIKTLVALSPLLGLLGTVTGMIEVFEVMAASGSGNTRAMASGVSRATIPTMAGMVAAISGFIFSVQLERRAEFEEHRIADRLSHEDRS